MTTSAFYSEFDPHAAAWLRELIVDGQISPGAVDERDIREVSAADLAGHGRVHLFAGIGGWELALRLAGWPAERSVWTGSCPCQPFSAAGKQKANADERHLWPEMFRLIRECRPDAVFGEQVEGAIRHGWLDGICRDLEGEGYAVGTAVLGAHSTGSPHIRQRLFWVAHAGHEFRERGPGEQRPARAGPAVGGEEGVDDQRGGATRRLADAELQRARRGDGQERTPEVGRDRPAIDGVARPVADADGGLAGDGGVQRGGQHGQQPEDGGPDCGVEHPASNGREQGRAESVGRGVASGCGARGGAPGAAASERPQGAADAGDDSHDSRDGSERHAAAPGGNFWGAFDLIPCRDGKARRVEPGSFPLAHGVPGRVGLLRGYGNAIVPQVAAAFVKAFMDATTRLH